MCAVTVIFGEVVLNAAISGFELWLCCVMPSVFPFFVCVSLLKESGFVTSSSAMSLFFGCALSGAPAGSRLCDAVFPDKDDGRFSEICAVCNMISPAFFTGSLFVLTGSRAAIFPVIIGHYAAAILMFTLTYKKAKIMPAQKPHPSRPFSAALSSAVTEGFISSVRVCGVIIFFTVLSALIIKLSTIFGINTLNPVFLFLLSMLEMTNGVAFLAGLDVSFPFMCALVTFCVSFGGLCIMMQTMSVVKINAKKYLLKKAETALLAGAITFIAALVIPQPQAVSSTLDEVLKTAQSGSVTLLITLLSSMLGVAVIALMCCSLTRTHRR